MPLFLRFRRSIAAVVFMAYLAGCYRWAPQGMTPQELIAAEHPSEVRVTLRDGTRHTLLRPSIGRDSLLGSRDGSPWSAPLTQVQHVEVRQLRTALTVIGVSAAVGIAALTTAGMVVLFDAGARGSRSWLACKLDPWCD